MATKQAELMFRELGKARTEIAALREKVERLERALSCIQVHLRGVPSLTAHEREVYEYARAALECETCGGTGETKLDLGETVRVACPDCGKEKE